VPNYVLINAVSLNGSKIVLIEKKKPEWQAGFLNLVGGRIEEGEDPQAAAIREFTEETGLQLDEIIYGGVIVAEDCSVYCFDALINDEQLKPRAEETEKVDWYTWEDVKKSDKLIPNLRLIVPLLFSGTTGWTLEVDSGLTNSFKITI
jgi:8-oxo-dGTP pyrophosphatase MutT (NUDIX family)